jgi:hypothetical protein
MLMLFLRREQPLGPFGAPQEEVSEGHYTVTCVLYLAKVVEKEKEVVAREKKRIHTPIPYYHLQ